MAAAVESEFSGRVEFYDVEGGVWTVVGKNGTRYQLFRAPKRLLKEGLNVSISGRIVSDVMTIAQVGPVLEVQSFSVSD
jgi:hypothetical protein